MPDPVFEQCNDYGYGYGLSDGSGYGNGYVPVGSAPVSRPVRDTARKSSQAGPPMRELVTRAPYDARSRLVSRSKSRLVKAKAHLLETTSSRKLDIVDSSIPDSMATTTYGLGPETSELGGNAMLAMDMTRYPDGRSDCSEVPIGFMFVNGWLLARLKREMGHCTAVVPDDLSTTCSIYKVFYYEPAHETPTEVSADNWETLDDTEKAERSAPHPRQIKFLAMFQVEGLDEKRTRVTSQLYDEYGEFGYYCEFNLQYPGSYLTICKRLEKSGRVPVTFLKVPSIMLGQLLTIAWEQVQPHHFSPIVM